MELSKRSLVIFCLGWLVSFVLTSCVAGYYYMEFQRETRLSSGYADMYSKLVQNYTSLLDDHLTLSREYVNMYELVENYTNLLDEYVLEKQNLTELLEKYGSCIMRVNICIDYKEWNATVVWYNNTIVPLGCDLLQATRKIAVVNSTYWPAYQASFVNAINGVWNSGARFWMWSRWNAEKEIWEYGEVGADRYKLTNSEIVMWRYEIQGYS